MVWKRFKLQRTCSWNISRLGLEVVLSQPSQNTSSFRTALTVSVWILSHLPHQKASPCRLQDPGCHLCTISTNPPFTVEALHVWSCRVCSSGLFLSRTRHGLEHTEIYRWIRWSRIFGNQWCRMFQCELQLQISSGYFLNAKGWDRLCSQAQRSPVGLCKDTVFIREPCWVPKDVVLALSNMCFQECCSTRS